MTTIQEAVDWITARHNFHHGFDHFQRFMASQGDPQDQLRAIHVAGTNGKGSTVSYLASVLREAGYTVGTFTSPHLVAHQDRIRIQERWIDDATFVRCVDTYRDLLEQWDLAMFEIDFFFACLWFIEQKVDIAVIEVGLGGLLDSTNTLRHPLCSVIVSIGLDHGTPRQHGGSDRLAESGDYQNRRAGRQRRDAAGMPGGDQNGLRRKAGAADSGSRRYGSAGIRGSLLRWRIRPIRCIPVLNIRPATRRWP